MKRRNIWILTAVLAAAVCFIFMIHGVRTEASEGPKLNGGTSAEIGDSFVLRLGFSSGTASASDLTLVVNRREGEETITPTGDTFLIPVDPDEMTLDLQPRLMNGTEEADRRTTPYSGALYAKALAESGLVDDSVKTMLADLLEYCAAAQAYYDYRTDDPANGASYQWTGYQPSGFTAPTPSAVSVENTGDGIRIRSANLWLEHDTIAVQFKGIATAGAAFTLNGSPAIPILYGTDFTMRSEALKMGELIDASYTLTVSDGVNSSTVTYSVANYIANKTSAEYEASGNQNMLNLAKRLWAYGGSAKVVYDAQVNGLELDVDGEDPNEKFGPLL
ncbi:MAG: hypothetical protein IK088_08050 [Lachnospiraceae bacterium]|nr:hypothetical protein [Lachnospiraceae bacterium]